MNRPKVFILGKLPPPWYGPAIATQILLKSKLKDHFDLIHIDTGLNQKLDSMGEFSWWKPFKGIHLYISYIFKILQKKPDLILIPHGQTTAAFIKDSIFIIMGWMAGRKILLQLRGSDWKNWLDGTQQLTQWYVKKNLSLASGVIVLGEKLRYLFQDQFQPDQIFVVPNGADYSIDPLNIHEHKSIEILFLSNLLPTKGVEDVLNAALILKVQNIQNIHFTFAGKWKNKEFEFKCNQLIHNRQLQVEILPPVSGDYKIRLLTETDIFVFPPGMPEGHPWVIVEAMAAGLPIISTDQGAITESVINMVNGFIVKPHDPEEIAERIRYLVDNPEERKRMGKESRRLYEENFTEEKMVERFTKVFNQVINS